MILFGALFLILIGAGFALGLVAIGGACLLGAMGIVSTSALVGILTRRVSTGLRALFVQVCVAVGAPCGLGAMWLFSEFEKIDLHLRWLLAGGAAMGAASGLVVALGFEFVLGHLRQRLLRQSPSEMPENRPRPR